MQRVQLVKRTCRTCSKEFDVQLRFIKKGEGHFCSRSCNAKSQGTRSASIKRFWARVEKSEGCWLWTGTVTNEGYGTWGVVRRSAHRFSYALHFGPIPDGLSVCHRCDNRLCVRPDHLFLGTHQDNMTDMTLKGRQARRIITVDGTSLSIVEWSKRLGCTASAISRRLAAGVPEQEAVTRPIRRAS